VEVADADGLVPMDWAERSQVRNETIVELLSEAAH
jgi:hypothetical protein